MFMIAMLPGPNCSDLTAVFCSDTEGELPIPWAPLFPKSWLWSGELFVPGAPTLEPMFMFGDGTSEVLNVPYFSSERCSACDASSGSSTPHLRARTLMMLSVRRAQSQSSAISSSCLTPWMILRLAVFSGRLSRWIVQAEWIM